MRPQIDISYTVHGKAKDLANESEIELDEIYEEALTRGIRDLEQQLIENTDDATQPIRSRRVFE